jgi:hypothetical protein
MLSSTTPSPPGILYLRTRKPEAQNRAAPQADSKIRQLASTDREGHEFHSCHRAAETDAAFSR